MTDAYQRNPTAPYGYKQLGAHSRSASLIGPALICAFIGGALGILVGTEFAAVTFRANTQAGQPGLAQVDSKASEFNSHPAANPEPNPKLEPQADGKTYEPGRPALRIAAVPTPAALNVSALHRHWPVRNSIGWKRSSTGRKTYSRSWPHFIPDAPAAASLPPDLEEVRLDNLTAEPFSFIVEGWVTVANYDASEGTIRTDEGKTFVIGTTVDGTDAIPWQDYHANVHYRCNQSGNCTLTRAGVSAPNAKMTT